MESILSFFLVAQCCVQDKSRPQTSGGPEGIHLKMVVVSLVQEIRNHLPPCKVPP